MEPAAGRPRQWSAGDAEFFRRPHRERHHPQRDRLPVTRRGQAIDALLSGRRVDHPDAVADRERVPDAPFSIDAQRVRIQTLLLRVDVPLPRRGLRCPTLLPRHSVTQIVPSGATCRLCGATVRLRPATAEVRWMENASDRRVAGRDRELLARVGPRVEATEPVPFGVDRPDRAVRMQPRCRAASSWRRPSTIR